MNSTNKPLEQCSLPELARLLVEDPGRQALAEIWADSAAGVVNDKIQMMRALIDRGADLDETDAQGHTALEILVDPNYRVSTDPKTVLALLQAGAGTCDGVMQYVIDRLYGEDIRGAALVFHERAQGERPLTPAGSGNYYHAMIDADPNALLMVGPVVDMVRRHDTGVDLDPEEIARLSGWLLETREKDGNTPVLLAWEAFSGMAFSSEQEKAQFQGYMLSELWSLTARYILRGGDIAMVNDAGRSIVDHIVEQDRQPTAFSQGEGEHAFAPDPDAVALVQATMLDVLASSAQARTSRPRF